MTAPLPLLEMTFPCIARGQFNDWLSSSGDKVADVELFNDGKYIYMRDEIIPEVPIDTIIKLNINLNGLSLSSPAYLAPQFPLLSTVDFLSPNAPNSIGWTMEQFQGFQVETADNTFNRVQSMITTDNIPTCDIVYAGIRATIQHSPAGIYIERRVLKLEKLLKYNEA